MSNQPLPLQPLTINDFSGGMTDYYKGNENLTECELLDNILINDNADPVTRPGCEIFDEDAPQLPTGEKWVADALDVAGDTLQYSARGLYYITGGVQTEIVGPTSNKVFPSGATETTKGSFALWNNQLLCANDLYAPIMRVYKNEAGAWKVNNLGLPYTELFGAIRLANELKADYNLHRADAAQHTAGVDNTNTVTAANADDYDTLITLTTQLLTKYAAHHADSRLATPAFHAATGAANVPLASVIAPTTLDECITRLNDLKAKYNAHDADATAHAVASSHQITSNILPNATGTAGAQNFVYAIYYAHSYYVGDVLFKETGPITLVEASSLNAPNTNAITLNNLLPLINGSTNNFDTTNCRLEIARTTNGGDTFYYLADQLASVTSYVDTTSDVTLQNNPPLYTEGGVLDNEPPPPAKYIAIVNDSLVLGNVKEGSVIRPSRGRISKRFQPFACPSEFAKDFDDNIAGVSGVNVYPIAFLNDKCYRLEGYFDATGEGGYEKKEISTKVGLVAPKSIVQIKDGLLFASDDGFYSSDAFSVRKISNSINETFDALSDKEDIVGTFDKKKNIILWGVKEDSAAEANDTLLVAHANYPKPNGDLAFTSWSGGNVADNFSATCLAYIDGYVLRGDHRGYLFRHDDNIFSDPKIDTSEAAADWYTSTIIYDIRSNAYDFGSADRRKWVPRIVVNANNVSTLSLAIESNNDNSGVFAALKPIVDNSNGEWGDPTAIWGDDSHRWNYFPMISAWRRFPGSRLRCQYKQVRFTNAYTLIDDSTTVGPASTNATTKAITLLSHPTFEWIDDPIGYNISFDTDDYATEYPITAVSGAVITVEDSENLLTTDASANWKIYGYKKREVLNLSNFVIQFGYITMTQSAYQGEE